MSLYVCRRIKLYSFLTEHNFKPKYIQPDKYDPDRLIWLYEETDDLKRAVSFYYEQMNERRNVNVRKDNS